MISAAGFFDGKALSSALYGVKPDDAFSYAMAVGGVAMVAVAASLNFQRAGGN